MVGWFARHVYVLLFIYFFLSRILFDSVYSGRFIWGLRCRLRASKHVRLWFYVPALTSNVMTLWWISRLQKFLERLDIEERTTTHQYRSSNWSNVVKVNGRMERRESIDRSPRTFSLRWSLTCNVCGVDGVEGFELSPILNRVILWHLLHAKAHAKSYAADLWCTHCLPGDSQWGNGFKWSISVTSSKAGCSATFCQVLPTVLIMSNQDGSVCKVLLANGIADLPMLTGHWVSPWHYESLALRFFCYLFISFPFATPLTV